MSSVLCRRSLWNCFLSRNWKLPLGWAPSCRCWQDLKLSCPSPSLQYCGDPAPVSLLFLGLLSPPNEWWSHLDLFRGPSSRCTTATVLPPKCWWTYWSILHPPFGQRGYFGKFDGPRCVANTPSWCHKGHGKSLSLNQPCRFILRVLYSR